MALTEIQLKIYRFHDSLSQRGSRPLGYGEGKLVWVKKRKTGSILGRL